MTRKEHVEEVNPDDGKSAEERQEAADKLAEELFKPQAAEAPSEGGNPGQAQAQG